MTDQLRMQALELAQKLFPTQNPQELVASAHTLESYLRNGVSETALAAPVPATPPTTRVWSTTDILTLTQCSRNAAFFAGKTSVLHPVYGAIPMNLMDYQRDTLNQIQAHNRVAICSSRQLGTSTMLAAYVLWHAAFTADQTIIVCSNRFLSACEILERIRFQLEALPQVIRPVIVSSNKAQIVLDNGSSISARALGIDACRGLTVNMLVVDNACYVSHSIGDAFMSSMMPLLAATRTKIIMASQAGQTRGMFYRAMQDPSYHTITLPWHVHPERDATWADSMKAAIGPESFAREYECQPEALLA